MILSSCGNWMISPEHLLVPQEPSLSADDSYIVTRADWEKKYSAYYWDMIRLVKLLPRVYEDPICCELNHFYIQHRDEYLTVTDNNPLGADPVYEITVLYLGQRGKIKNNLGERLFA